jgi:hypothetical protein
MTLIYEQKYKFTPSSESDGYWLWGWVSPTYHTGGYIVDIPLDMNTFNQTFTDLYNDRWVDKQVIQKGVFSYIY